MGSMGLLEKEIGAIYYPVFMGTIYPPKIKISILNLQILLPIIRKWASQYNWWRNLNRRILLQYLAEVQQPSSSLVHLFQRRSFPKRTGQTMTKTQRSYLRKQMEIRSEETRTLKESTKAEGSKKRPRDSVHFTPSLNMEEKKKKLERRLLATVK